jgi:hypothetical protein
MINKPSSLLQDDDLITLPSTKVHPSERVGVHSWFKDYSAFSAKFALAAIESIADSNKSVVFDPFLGTGTSLVASTKLGLPFVGVELSSFSALLSRAKVSQSADPETVLKLLKVKALADIDIRPELMDYYSREDLSYTSTVFYEIAKLINKDSKQLLKALIEKKGKDYDSTRVALVILLLCARTVSKTLKGSNPVWYKVTKKDNRKNKVKLSDITVRRVEQFIDDLKKEDYKSTQIKTYWGDARDTKLPDNSFDVLLTSPPYLNRLDYVVSQLPEVILLSLLYNQDLDLLKKKMVGTTKIVEKGDPDPLWGKSCLEILSKIRNHSSKASSTYYIWNYYKYFKDMYACFNEFDRLARQKAKGLLVVQNSHYKDIDIPVTKIFSEMGETIGISIKEVKELSVKSHMGLLSPQQRTYTPNKVLKEAILHLEFR